MSNQIVEKTEVGPFRVPGQPKKSRVRAWLAGFLTILLALAAWYWVLSPRLRQTSQPAGRRLSAQV